MTILTSLILGIIEGLTEFLPISSTFHLIFASQLLHLASSPYTKMFEVVIQGGAISALLFIYTKTLLSNLDLTRRVVVSFIPTALVGAVLYKVIKDIFFESNYLMLVAFMAVGLIFFIIEYLVKHQGLVLSKKLADLSYRQSLAIGFAQSLAVIPGVSRAGSVIVTMMGMGFRREEAARYTFLLSLPTILAASALDLFKNRAILTGLGHESLTLFLGFTTAFIVAYLVVKWLLQYLSSHTLNLFGWYRLILGTAIFYLLWL